MTHIAHGIFQHVDSNEIISVEINVENGWMAMAMLVCAAAEQQTLSEAEFMDNWAIISMIAVRRSA